MEPTSTVPVGAEINRITKQVSRTSSSPAPASNPLPTPPRPYGGLAKKLASKGGKDGRAGEAPEDNNKQGGLDWLSGGTMIAVAGLFDLIIGTIGLLNFSIIGIIVVIAVAWVPSLFAFMTFMLWLAIKGEASLLKATLLMAPLGSGCLGIPGWTATIWPLVAKTIAAKTIKKVAPGAVGEIASHALSGKMK